jgi:hypothetical protein
MNKIVLFLVAIMVFPTAVAEDFPVQNINSGFVGWSQGDGTLIDEYRISYPSISDGEDTNVAQNGPFAIVVFIPDDGESVEQYIWLQDGLSKWGYVTLVVSSEWDLVEQQLIDWNQNGTDDLPSLQGMLAINHISLSGHGTGAHEAAEIVKSGVSEIDGLFGLGFDGTSTSTTSEILLSNPASALFLTGTTDEIAPANENIMTYTGDWSGAWQIMHPRGANHLGYQESDTFFERFADGDSTMGREGQQEHALNHILPYLNLSLRGDDSAYQAAFNREDKSVSSDPDAYIDEDLSRSRLYDMNNISSTALSVLQDQEFTISSDVSMRDGGIALGNTTCLLPNGDTVPGILQNGIASCTLNGSMLSPGEAMIEIQVADYSFSDWLEFTIIRLGSPLEITTPLPEVSLNQHSFVTLTPDVFAVDPDGEDVVFIDAYMVADNDSILLVDNSLTDLTITHQNLQEWSGTMEMNLVLAAGDDMANLTVNVTVIPVNDIVVQDGVIPQQQTVEDGESIVVDLSQYVSDPEGQTLVVVSSREYPGLRVDTTLPTILIDPQTHWNGAELVELLVSDGVTEPITVVVPINVAPVDDAVEFTDSEIEVEMDEDGVLILNLENFTVDVDDDDLIYELSGSSEIVGFSLTGSELVLAGNPDLFGISLFTVNVSDGSSNSSMNLTVDTKSIPDLPVVGISTVDVDGNTISILWTISDKDGDAGLIYSVKFGDESIEQGTECIGDKLLTCITNTPTGPEGTYTVEVRVWDGIAQEWSNTATKEVDVKDLVLSQDDAESEVAIGDWVLPIGLGLIVVLLVGYLILSKRE